MNTSYVVKSRGKSLAQIAAEGDWGFIEWAARNMWVQLARREAQALLDAEWTRIVDAARANRGGAILRLDPVTGQVVPV